MTTFNHPFLCVYCKHLNHERYEPGRLFCKAFPEGIPEAIIANETDHREPVTGDHGVRFEQDAGSHRPPLKDIFPVQ